jgi:MarR family 2-MHQ and catechol resistance regulon transcriptional repressor
MEKEQLLQELVNNMTVIRRLMMTCMQQSNETTRLPVSQFELLFLVQQHGATSLKTLAKAMQITPGAVTQLVESLEKSGLISRQQSPTDRRVTLIDITQKGKTTFEALHIQKTALFQQVYSTLEPEELRLMNKVQKKIIANMEAISKASKEKE